MADSLIHIIIAFLLLTGLTFLSVVGALDSVIDAGRVTAHTLAIPVTEAFAFLDWIGESFSSVRALQTENQNLRLEVAELTAEVAVLKSREQENSGLRQALSFQSESRLNLIPAEVITLDPLGQEQQVVLNRGKKHGVRQGEAVLAADQVMVGVIASVLENSSVMELVTSSGVSINAETASGRATGVIRGEHGLGMIFDLISQNEEVTEGDLVLTSGLGGQFPGDLLVGEVSEIRSSSSELFQKATVVPAVKLKDLRFVFVINQ